VIPYKAFKIHPSLDLLENGLGCWDSYWQGCSSGAWFEGLSLSRSSETTSLFNIHFLYQAKSPSADLNYCTKWLSSADLGLSGVLAQEWTFFCMTLTEAGIRLHTEADVFLWNGGDRSGLLTARNVYREISSTIWDHRCIGWHKNLWQWPIALKQKLFVLLALNDKLSTWDLLQRRGWIGPNLCFLCRRDSKSIFHLFWDYPITKQLWFIILSSLNINLRWTRTSLQDCIENWSLLDTIYPHLPVIMCWFV